MKEHSNPTNNIITWKRQKTRDGSDTVPLETQHNYVSRGSFKQRSRNTTNAVTGTEVKELHS